MPDSLLRSIARRQREVANLLENAAAPSPAPLEFHRFIEREIERVTKGSCRGQRSNIEELAEGGKPERGGVVLPLNRVFGRDLGVDVDSAGGYTVDKLRGFPKVLGELALAPAVERAGATIISGLTGDTAVPIFDSALATSWMGSETAMGNELDPSFRRVLLSPKTTISYVDLTRSLLKRNSSSIDQAVSAYLKRVVARAIDQAALIGTGASGQPTGLVNTSGVGSYAIGTNGGPLTRAHLGGIVKVVADANGLPPDASAAFVANSKTAGAAYLVESGSGSGNFLFKPETDAGSGLLGDWPAYIGDNLPSNGTKGSGTDLSTMIFGDWSQLIIGLFGGVELLIDPMTFAPSGTVRILVYQSIDIGVAQPAAFCKCTDITT